MYDDRLEISSPGGVYKGRAIQDQDINKVKSERRNPILADLFSRMRYMERRGSGLQKIVNETQKLYGYKDDFKPEFYSDTSFTVTLYNVNYNPKERNVGDNIGDNIGDSIGDNIGDNNTQYKIITIMKNNPKVSAKIIAEEIGIAPRNVEVNISVLKKTGKIKRIGSPKGGYWEVID